MTKYPILIAFLLPLAACVGSADAPPTGPSPIVEGNHQSMSCDQLAAASKSAASDLAWVRRQQQETFSGDTTSNVTLSMPIGGSGGSGDGPRVGRLNGEQASLRSAMAAKGCE